MDSNSIDSKPLKDSGKRDQFETGAVRDVQDGKGRYDLISPIAMRRLALHLEKGALKYDAHNWKKGMPIGRTFDSLLRHSFMYLGGDRTEDHLAAILCNAMFIVHYEEMMANNKLPAAMNDLCPDYDGSQENWLSFRKKV